MKELNIIINNLAERYKKNYDDVYKDVMNKYSYLINTFPRMPHSWYIQECDRRQRMLYDRSKTK